MSTSTEYPRRCHGVTATRLRGISASQPRRRRDPSPRNIRVAAAASPATRLRGISTSRATERGSAPSACGADLDDRVRLVLGAEAVDEHNERRRERGAGREQMAEDARDLRPADFWRRGGENKQGVSDSGAARATASRAAGPPRTMATATATTPPAGSPRRKHALADRATRSNAERRRNGLKIGVLLRRGGMITRPASTPTTKSKAIGGCSTQDAVPKECVGEPRRRYLIDALAPTGQLTQASL